MNDITELRQHLFDTIKAVKDPQAPLDVPRARVIAELSQVLINSAKVEVEFIRAVGQNVGTGFVPEQKPISGQPRLVPGNSQSGSK